jgi:hypothetical protein
MVLGIIREIPIAGDLLTPVTDITSPILDPVLGGGDGGGGLVGGGGLIGGGSGGGLLEGLLGPDGLLDLGLIGGGGGDDLLGGGLGGLIGVDGLLGLEDILGGSGLDIGDLISTDGLLGAIGGGTADDGLLRQVLTLVTPGGTPIDGLLGSLLDSPGDPGLIRQLLTGIVGDEEGLLDDLLDLLLGQNNAGNDGPDPGGPDGPDDPNAYDVVLTGTEGNDTFAIGAESTYVAGLGGLDTAVYMQSSDEFTYGLGPDAIILTDATNTDYLQSVERVQFTDGTLHLDIGVGENAGFAFRLYAAALDRGPDEAGLKFWINRVDTGDSREDIAQGFVNSLEFNMNYGLNLSNAEFVSVLYQNILGRQADAAGQQFFVDLLDGGASRGLVLAGVSESNENVSNTAAEIGDFIFIA